MRVIFTLMRVIFTLIRVIFRRFKITRMTYLITLLKYNPKLQAHTCGRLKNYGATHCAAL
jgi:hypothetical protein